MSWLVRLLAIAAALVSLSPANAQEAAAPPPGAQHLPGDSVSYSTWAIDGRVVRLQVALPAAEADKLAGPKGPAPDAAAVSEAVAAAFAASSDKGPCAVVDQGEGEGEIYRLALTPGIDRFEIIYLCPSATGIAISDKLLFDRVPGHIDFARVQAGKSPPFVAMFTRDRRTLNVPASRTGARWPSFLRQGARNLLRHADLLLVLAGIALFCARRRDLLFVAGSIATGQAIAAIFAVEGLGLGWPKLAGAATGVFVAGLGAAVLRARNAGQPLSRGWRIAVVGALALATLGAIAIAARTGPVAAWAAGGACLVCLAMLWGVRAPGQPHWLTWFPALLLGLLSGLAIGTDLAVLALPATGTLAPMAAWMLGATIAAVAVAALAVLALWLIGRGGQSRRDLASEIAGAALIGFGLFWFVSRVWT